MNITLVCGSLLPALRYGGTERVVWALGKELHRMGHRITFLAAPGSRCDFARVVPLDPALPVERQLPADTELVHFHTHYAGPIAKPHLVTVHGNLPPAGATADCVFVSRNHAQRFGCEAYVWNGLDWEGDYAAPDLSLARRGYHFLGKAAWRVKNLRGAIRLSGRLGERLDVLGGYRLNLKMGLRLTLTPRVRFHGMVDNAAKKRLIERSKGLLFPVRWHEPFGLAVPESLWYGAPVFATPYGSLPELVTPDVGFLGTDAAELAERMAAAGFSPARCHEYARETFDSHTMARSYLAYYEQVLRGERLNAAPPRAAAALETLPWKD